MLEMDRLSYSHQSIPPVYSQLILCLYPSKPEPPFSFVFSLLFLLPQSVRSNAILRLYDRMHRDGSVCRHVSRSRKPSATCCQTDLCVDAFICRHVHLDGLDKQVYRFVSLHCRLSPHRPFSQEPTPHHPIAKFWPIHSPTMLETDHLSYY